MFNSGISELTPQDWCSGDPTLITSRAEAEVTARPESYVTAHPLPGADSL